MSNFEVFIILKSMGAHKGSNIFPRRRAREILNEQDLAAAEILYELANGKGKKMAKNLGKRKIVEDGISNSPNNSAQSLCNKVMAEDSGDHNYSHTGKGKLKIEQDLAAAEILYELANGKGKKMAKNLGKIKIVEDGISNSPNNSAQSLCNKVMAEDSGDHNYSHTGKGKLKIEAPSKNDFDKTFEDRKRLNQVTIGESSNDERRACFRREEAMRYLFIGKSFKYTALDGAKSSVAPLRKKCEKTIRKSRGHHIFKDGIPPKFTLLSLVRDASARLPSGVGTRDDICELVRESQYVLDDISDKKLKQIVSWTLDRLHSEVDPCVKFNRERGLWAYLHRDRREEDFREDGTSSLKGKMGKERTDSN